ERCKLIRGRVASIMFGNGNPVLLKQRVGGNLPQRRFEQVLPEGGVQENQPKANSPPDQFPQSASGILPVHLRTLDESGFLQIFLDGAHTCVGPIDKDGSIASSAHGFDAEGTCSGKQVQDPAPVEIGTD